MQRVRIGLTGLAFVFLLVLLAAIVTDPTSEPPITANSLETGEEAVPGNQAEPEEPLAQLGVAPRNPDSNAAAPAAPAEGPPAPQQ